METEEDLEYEIYWKHKIKSINNINISDNGKYIVVGTIDGFLYLLDDSGTVTWKQQLDGLNSLSISEDASNVAAGSDSGKLYLYKIDGKLVWQKKVGKINAILFTHTSNIIVGTESSTIICFDRDGSEIWKKKIKGFFEGGIRQAGGSDSIIAGSWNQVYCFSPDGEILWKFRTEKRIKSVDVSNEFIAVGTRSGIDVIDNSGGSISHIDQDCEKVCIKNELLYIFDNSRIDIINSNGQLLHYFKLDEDIFNFDVCRNNGNIVACSKNYINNYSTALKPELTILTELLILGESQPLEFEIKNVCNKKMECDIELNLDSHIYGNILMELEPNETKAESFLVTPVKPGLNNIIINIKNKNYKINKEIFVDAEQIKLNVELSPKYEFNVADDETTLMIKVVNNTGLNIRNISVVEDGSLFLEELSPGSDTTFEFKIHLAEGKHYIERHIVCEDEFDNKYNFTCGNEITIVSAPYVWSFTNADKLINGKESDILLKFKNITNQLIDLKVRLESESIVFQPDIFDISVGPLQEENLTLLATPDSSGEVPVYLFIEENSKEKRIPTVLNIDKKSPLLKINTSLDKNVYFIGELVLHRIELKNDGEQPALNVEIEGFDKKIPSIQPGESITHEIKHTFTEVAHEKLPAIRVKYEDSSGAIFEEESDQNLEFDVRENEINILTSEISLIENISKKCGITIENKSDNILENVECELVINNPNIDVGDTKNYIERFNPRSKCTLDFSLVSGICGTEEFKLIIRYDDKEFTSSGFIITETKLPEFELTIDHSGLLVDNFSILKIDLKNISEVLARNVSFKLNMPITMKSDPLIDYNQNKDLVEVGPGQSIPLRFNLIPENAGEVNIDIILAFESVQGKQVEHKITSLITIEKEQNQNEQKEQSIHVNIGEIVGGHKITDSVVQRSNLSAGLEAGCNGGILTRQEMGEPDRLKTYRNLCVQAYDDKVITDDEKDILVCTAKSLNISLEEKNSIEMEIFGEKLNKDHFFIAYKEAFIKALTNDGNISDDERKMLDTLRENYNLSTQDQEIIEADVIQQYKNRIR